MRFLRDAQLYCLPSRGHCRREEEGATAEGTITEMEVSLKGWYSYSNSLLQSLWEAQLPAIVLKRRRPGEQRGWHVRRNGRLRRM